MKKIVLNIICNNDAHTVGKMLDSIRSLVDAVLAIETGSTDETLATIKKFGFLSSIPTFAYKKPFDNASNSRNFALDRLSKIIADLSWHPTQVWVLAIDCNEILQLPDQFQKDDLKDDLYLVPCRQKGKQFIKLALFKLSAGLRRENPVTTSVLSNWQLISQSANKHSQTQENWLKYFETIVHLATDTKKESLAYQDLAQNKLALGAEWENIQPLFLLSYSDNTTRAESLAPIIRHYMEKKEWHLAHLFSNFAYHTYHNKPPELDTYPIETSLYEWELLYYYYICCAFTARTREVKDLRKQLRKYAFSHPTNFSFIHLTSIFVPGFYRFAHHSMENR